MEKSDDVRERNYFYLREVLFGLRNYYLKYNEYLELLKKYTINLDKRISNYYFACDYIHNKNGLLCMFEDKTFVNKIKQIIVGNPIGLGIDVGRCYKNDNGVWIIDDVKYNTQIDATKQKEFNDLANEILSSLFVKYINNKNIQTVENFNDVSSKLYFSTEAILFGMYETIKDVYKDDFDTINIANLSYYRYGDSLNISNFKNNLDNDTIISILESKIDKNLLNDFHYNSIVNSPSINKKISFDDHIVRCDNVKFFIEEDEENIVLKKVKK
jgi:hypothetical protein